MPRKNSHKLSSDIRRDQIARATLRIIAKKGLKGLTTAAIAREAGISEGNLYRHFRNKEEIISVTVDKIGEGMRENIETVFKNNPNLTPLEKLKRLYKLHLEYIEKNNGIPKLLFSEEIHIGSEEIKQKILSNISLYSSSLEHLIREGQKKGVVRTDINSRAGASMLIGMVQVTILKWSLSGFAFSLSKEGMKLWKNFETCLTQG